MASLLVIATRLLAASRGTPFVVRCYRIGTFALAVCLLLSLWTEPSVGVAFYGVNPLLVVVPIDLFFWAVSWIRKPYVPVLMALFVLSLPVSVCLLWWSFAGYSLYDDFWLAIILISLPALLAADLALSRKIRSFYSHLQSTIGRPLGEGGGRP